MGVMMRIFTKWMFLSVLMLNAAFALADQVVVSDPWIREAPPGSMMMGGFVNLSNTSDQTVHLKSASSDSFKFIELHLSIVENGLARMIEQDSIEIPAGGMTALKPGSYHLMLMRPVKPLKRGDDVTLNLVFDNGQEMSVSFPVIKK